MNPYLPIDEQWIDHIEESKLPPDWEDGEGECDQDR